MRVRSVLLLFIVGARLFAVVSECKIPAQILIHAPEMKRLYDLALRDPNGPAAVELGYLVLRVVGNGKIANAPEKLSLVVRETLLEVSNWVFEGRPMDAPLVEIFRTAKRISASNKKDPYPLLSHYNRQEFFWGVLEFIPPKDAEILRLATLPDLEIPQIAERVGLPEAEVSRRVDYWVGKIDTAFLSFGMPHVEKIDDLITAARANPLLLSPPPKFD